jgi:hypothetical protein
LGLHPQRTGQASGAKRLVVAAFTKRPDLLPKFFEHEIQSAVPEFMRYDPTAAHYYGDGNLKDYLDYGLVAIDPAVPDRPVTSARSACHLPFATIRVGAIACPMAAGTR